MTDWMQLILAAAEKPKEPGMDPMGWIWMLVLIFIAFYFIIIRPQKREQAQKQKMVETLQKGDRVVTIGGIHGRVAGVDQTRNTVSIDVGKNVKLEFSRSAISSIEKKGKKPGEEAGEKGTREKK